MSWLSRLLGFGLSSATAIGLAGAGAAEEPNPPDLQIDCSASGAKLFAPPTTEEALCARFAAALRSHPLPDRRLTVELRFASHGIASATVSRAPEGRISRFELAVSDRRFAQRDLDRLAADVVTGLKDLLR